MAESMSADEVLAKLKASMGEELGALFHVLSGELTWLCWRWREFVELFATKESRLNLVNRSVPFFFYVVRQTLWYERVLAISRLAGPMRRDPIPTSPFGASYHSSRTTPFATRSKGLVEDMDTACEFVTPWRNKHIAHRDLERGMGRQAQPLPEVTKERISSFPCRRVRTGAPPADTERVEESGASVASCWNC